MRTAILPKCRKLLRLLNFGEIREGLARIKERNQQIAVRLTVLAQKVRNAVAASEVENQPPYSVRNGMVVCTSGDFKT